MGTVHERKVIEINSRWRQAAPYNWIINRMAGNNLNDWQAGCAAVAMAKIMAYHEWPKKPPAEIRRPTS
jgi:hypothetical protein